MESKYKSQKNYQKTNMLPVKGTYKKDFVDDFKYACTYLNKTQAEVIRKVMEETIKEAISLIDDQVSQVIKNAENKIKEIEKCEDKEHFQIEIIRYTKYIELIKSTVKLAIKNHHYVNVIHGCIYISDGKKALGDTIESTATFVSRIYLPQDGTEVVGIVDEQLPFLFLEE